jgi:hypothetical protein
MKHLSNRGFFSAGAAVIFTLYIGLFWNGCAGDVVIVEDTGSDGNVSDGAADGGNEPDAAEDASGGDGANADAGDGSAGDGAIYDAGDGGKKDGGADGGALHPAVIKFGTGLDIWTRPDAGASSLVVMKETLSSVEKVLGTGTPTAKNKWIRNYAKWALDAVYVDATDKKNPDSSSNLLQGFILYQDFNGATPAGHGPGDTKKAWETELGKPEYSYAADTGTTDIYYTKGASVIYDTADLASTITVYRKQKVVPSQDIDWQALQIFTIKESLDDSKNSPFSDVEFVLGPADQENTYVQTIGGSKVTLEARYYLSLGLSFWGQQSKGRVNMAVVTAPYFGKLIGSTGLTIGSTYADVTAFFAGVGNGCVDATGAKAACVEKQIEYTNPDTGEKFTLYYYWIRREDVYITVAIYMSVGFLYSKDKDGNPDRLVSVMIGYPAQNK